MFFWLAVVVGALLSVLAVRIGLYEMVAVFMNCLVAVYLAIFLTPTLVSLIPAATDVPGGGVIMVAAIAVGTFAVLQGLCSALLTGQFRVSFPKILDWVMAGGLGFLAGFLVVAFLTILLATSPLARVVALVSDNDLKVHQSYVCWWCDRVHRLVGSTASTHPTQDTLNQLRKIESRESPSKPRRVTEPNAPVGMACPPSTRLHRALARTAVIRPTGAAWTGCTRGRTRLGTLADGKT